MQIILKFSNNAQYHMQEDFFNKYGNKQLQTKEMKREYKNFLVQQNKTFSEKDTKKKRRKKKSKKKKDRRREDVKRTNVINQPSTCNNHTFILCTHHVKKEIFFFFTYDLCTIQYQSVNPNLDNIKNHTCKIVLPSLHYSPKQESYTFFICSRVNKIIIACGAHLP